MKAVAAACPNKPCCKPEAVADPALSPASGKSSHVTGSPAAVDGGDAVTGAATVISAMGAGKVAAKAIDEYLSKKQLKR